MSIVGSVTGGPQDMGVQVSAVVYSACICGHAYPQHRCACGCEAYRPLRQPRGLGTRAYTPPGRLSYLRRVGCLLAWALEVRLQGWRERMDGTGGQ